MVYSKFKSFIDTFWHICGPRVTRPTSMFVYLLFRRGTCWTISGHPDCGLGALPNNTFYYVHTHMLVLVSTWMRCQRNYKRIHLSPLSGGVKIGVELFIEDCDLLLSPDNVTYFCSVRRNHISICCRHTSYVWFFFTLVIVITCMMLGQEEPLSVYNRWLQNKRLKL